MYLFSFSLLSIPIAPPNIPNELSENCRDFLMKTFQFNPEDRPTAADLLEHPFVRGGSFLSFNVF